MRTHTYRLFIHFSLIHSLDRLIMCRESCIIIYFLSGFNKLAMVIDSILAYRNWKLVYESVATTHTHSTPGVQRQTTIRSMNHIVFLATALSSGQMRNKKPFVLHSTTPKHKHYLYWIQLNHAIVATDLFLRLLNRKHLINVSRLQ